MKFKRLSKYFPPPKFLKPPHIGISISDTSIKAILFEKMDTAPRFKSAIVSLERGAVVNGSIVDMAEVVKKLSIIRKNFSLPFVFFTVPDELTYIFFATVPTSGGDITEAVAFILEENVPLSLNETIFDFTPTQIIKSESDYTVSVVVAACVKKEVEKFLEVFRKAGFEPVGCVHESQAITKAVLSRKLFGAYCVVQAQEDRIGIYLIKNKIVYFSTIRNITTDNYKKEFLDEYDKFLEYCSKYDIKQNQPVNSIFVCGEFGSAQKIVEAVDDSESLPNIVKLSNVWTNVFEIDKYIPDIPFEKSLSFAGAIGAALTDIK
jgi:hypothetical protein